MTEIVLLPGMDGTGSLFKTFVAVLGARAHVISYPPDKAMAYEELGQFVRTRLPEGKPFILIAESFSGPIGIAISACPPIGLKALVLVCTFAKLPGPRLPKLFHRLVSRVPIWKAPSSLASKVLFGQFASVEDRAQLTRSVRSVASAVWSTRLQAVLSADVTEALAKVRVPVLYLRASNDAVVPRSASELIAASNKGVKVVEIIGPHFLLQAKPMESATAVRGFARDLGLTL